MGTYGEPRLSEVIQAYKDLGISVKCLAADQAEQRGCNHCITGAKENLRAVYICQAKPDISER